MIITIKKMAKDLLINYFDEHSSFTVSVNLLTSGARKYIVFKPMISFVSTNKKIIQAVMVHLEMKNPITVVKQNNNIGYQVRVQDFKEINHVINTLNKDKLQYKRRVNSIEQFITLFTKIQNIGHIHKEWKPEFVEILELKEQLNIKTRTRKGFTKTQWIDKIKNHF